MWFSQSKEDAVMFNKQNNDNNKKSEGKWKCNQDSRNPMSNLSCNIFHSCSVNHFLIIIFAFCRCFRCCVAKFSHCIVSLIMWPLIKTKRADISLGHREFAEYSQSFDQTYRYCKNFLQTKKKQFFDFGLRHAQVLCSFFLRFVLLCCVSWKMVICVNHTMKQMNVRQKNDTS